MYYHITKYNEYSFYRQIKIFVLLYFYNLYLYTLLDRYLIKMFQVSNMKYDILMKTVGSSWTIQTAIRRGNIELKLSAGSPYNYRCWQNHFVLCPQNMISKKTMSKNKNAQSHDQYKNVKENKFNLDSFLWMDGCFLFKKEHSVVDAFQICKTWKPWMI